MLFTRSRRNEWWQMIRPGLARQHELELFRPEQESPSHVPGNQSARGKPQVLGPAPVLVLGTPDFRPQERRAYLAMLVESDPVLEEAPSAIDDLGAALGL